MPACGKNPLKIFFHRTEKQQTVKLGISHEGFEAYQVYDVPGFTLEHFMERSNLQPDIFIDIILYTGEKNVPKSTYVTDVLKSFI